MSSSSVIKQHYCLRSDSLGEKKQPIGRKLIGKCSRDHLLWGMKAEGLSREENCTAMQSQQRPEPIPLGPLGLRWSVLGRNLGQYKDYCPAVYMWPYKWC